MQASAINRFQRIIQIEIDREYKNIATNQGILERFSEKISQTESLLNTANINPAYEVILREITSLELSQLRSLENIETLKGDYDALETYRYANYDEYKNSSNLFDQVSVDLTVNSDIIVTPVNRFNPPMMIAISGMMGLMLGIFIVYFIQYWKSN